jgi:hypothetical protein
MLDLIVEIVLTDWSKRYVALRTLVLVGVFVVFRAQAVHALEWLAQQRAHEITQVIQNQLRNLPTIQPSSVGLTPAS